MNKSAIFLSLIFVVSVLSSATRVVPLSDHGRPNYIAADDRHVYISDFPSVYIYDAVDFKLLKKFGKKGEGPREFQNYANITLSGNRIVVNSVGKISLFTHDGDFVSEKKLGGLGRGFKPAGSHWGKYAVSQEDKIVYQTIEIVDVDFKKVRQLNKYPNWIQQQGPMAGVYPVNMVRFGLLVSEGCLVTADMEKFKVYIWHEKGDRVVTIERPYELLPFTAADRERYDIFFKTDPVMRNNYEALKPRFKWPGRFPPIHSFGVGGGKVYVYTYRWKEGKREFFIYDLEGNFLKHTFLPLKGDIAFWQFPYNFHGDKLYQMVENEEEEEWELHITDIE